VYIGYDIVCEYNIVYIGYYIVYIGYYIVYIGYYIVYEYYIVYIGYNIVYIILRLAAWAVSSQVLGTIYIIHVHTHARSTESRSGYYVHHTRYVHTHAYARMRARSIKSSSGY
jgi:hypothetical protein